MERIGFADFKAKVGEGFNGKNNPAKQALQKQLILISPSGSGWVEIITTAKVSAEVDWDGGGDREQNFVNNLAKGNGDSRLAIALYYWLHTDKDPLSFAAQVDKIVFDGQTFSERFGRQVLPVETQADLKATNELLVRLAEAGERADEQWMPELFLGEVAPDPGTWLSPFNQVSIPFFGREDELSQLNDFLEDDQEFQLWALVGPSGSGKTRLASHWLKSSCQATNWHKGFIKPAEIGKFDKWRPKKNTVFIVDDLFENRRIISAIVERCSQLQSMMILRYKVRLLIIDRIFPNTIEQLLNDVTWNSVFKNSSDLDNKRSVFFSKKELSLMDTVNSSEILERILCIAAGLSAVNNFKIVVALDQLKSIKGAAHPLFAALFGRAISHANTIANRRELISYFVSGSDRNPLMSDVEDGAWIGCIVAAATILNGVSFHELIAHLPEQITHDANRVSKILAHASRIVSNKRKSELCPFEPDIMGELFVLAVMRYLKNSPPTYERFQRMCSPFGIDAKKDIEFISFFRGLGENLCSEDLGDFQVKEDWKNVVEFLRTDRRECSVSEDAIHNVILMELFNVAKRSGNEEIGTQIADAINWQCFFDESLALSVSAEYSRAVFEFADGYIQALKPNQDTKDELVEVVRCFQSDDKNPISALHISAANNYPTLCETLIVAGDDVNEVEPSAGVTALMAACENGNAEVVDLLLSNGADANLASTENGSTPLMWASQEGQCDVCSSLLNAGATLNCARFTDGASALHMAATHDEIEAIRLLVARGADINLKTTDTGLSPLAVACQKNNSRAILLLLELGACPNDFDIEGEPLLSMTIRFADYAIVKALVLSGADVNSVDRESLLTPIHIAVVNGEMNTTKLLIENGANINVISSDLDLAGRLSPLVSALVSDNIDIARYLISSGADPNYEYEPGNPCPLAFPASHGDLTTFKMLLDSGANPNAISVGNWTALTAAASEGHVEIARELLKRQANIELAGGDNLTPLIHAVSSGNLELVDMLLDHGADPRYVSGGDYKTALNYAAQYGAVDVLAKLDNLGLGIESFGENFEHPMITAAQYGSIESVEYYSKLDIDVDLVSGASGLTALIAASMNGHAVVVRSLIDMGADLNACDVQQGSTALMWAVQSDWDDVVDLLVRAGADCNHSRYSDGHGPLHTAATRATEGQIRKLLDAGVDVNAAGKLGITPIMSAAASGHIETIDVLHRAGADLSEKDHSGRNARTHALLNGQFDADERLRDLNAPGPNVLYKAVYWGICATGLVLNLIKPNKVVIRLSQQLLDRCIWGHKHQIEPLLLIADANYQDEKGNSALSISLVNGHAKIAHLLIEHGANPSLRNHSGQNAIDIARLAGQDDMVEMLVAAESEMAA